jgi:ligand-binding sensor domain-containing protein
MRKTFVVVLVLWFCSGLLAQVTTTAWVTFSTLDDTLVIGNPVRSITADLTGRVWWGTAHGLYKQSGDSCLRYIYDDSSFAQKSRNNILSVVTTVAGDLFSASPVGLTQHSGFSFTSDSLITYPILPDSEVTMLCPDSSEDGLIWGAGEQCLWLWADTVEAKLTTTSGLAGYKVYDMVHDSTHSFWIATNGGVSRLIDNHWITYTTVNSGLNGNVCYTIAVSGRDSSIWFGGDDGLVQFDGDTTWTDWTDSLPNHRVKDLAFCAEDTTMWVATDSGLAAYKPNRPYPISTWRKYFPETTGDSLPQYRIFCVYPDSGKCVWIGHSTGVTRLKEN